MYFRGSFLKVLRNTKNQILVHLQSLIPIKGFAVMFAEKICSNEPFVFI